MQHKLFTKYSTLSKHVIHTTHDASEFSRRLRCVSVLAADVALSH